MTIKLPNFSWKILNDLLTTTPWATTPKDVVIAGRMDADNQIKLPAEPVPQLTEDWKNEETELDFGPAEVAACKKCLETLVPQKIFFANKYSSRLIAAFVQID